MVLSWWLFSIGVFVFLLSMCFICIRIYKDRQEIKKLLSPSVIPVSRISLQIPMATSVVLVATPVNVIENGLEIANSQINE